MPRQLASPPSCRAAVADSGVPPVIPSASPCSTRTQPSPVPPPPSLPPARLRCMARTSRDPSGLFKSPAAPWTPPPEPPPLPAVRRWSQNTSFCRRRRIPASAAASSSGSRSGAAPGGELHARAVCCRARAPWLPSDLARVPAPRRRVVRPRRRVSAAAAAPGRFIASRATRRCLPHPKPCAKTLVRVRHRRTPPPFIASRRRRFATAAGRRSLAI
jgi:hypothetical protein